MTKVNGIRIKVRNRKNVFDRLLIMSIHMFAEEDGRFTEVRSLTRGQAEVLKDVVDGVCFSTVSLATNDEVIGK